MVEMSDERATDERAMDAALDLAARARRIAPPNPWVGCVIVGADGTELGAGSTQAPGGAHAEVGALAAAGAAARGATAYVTLEPCVMCAGALLNARVSLVISQRDRVVASYAVLGSIGRLTAQELELEVAYYDPNIHYEQVKTKWFGVDTPDGR